MSDSSLVLLIENSAEERNHTLYVWFLSCFTDRELCEERSHTLYVWFLSCFTDRELCEERSHTLYVWFLSCFTDRELCRREKPYTLCLIPLLFYWERTPQRQERIHSMTDSSLVLLMENSAEERSHTLYVANYLKGHHCPWCVKMC